MTTITSARNTKLSQCYHCRKWAKLTHVFAIPPVDKNHVVASRVSVHAECRRKLQVIHHNFRASTDADFERYDRIATSQGVA